MYESKKHDVYMVNNDTIPLNMDDDEKLVQTDIIAKLVIGYLA